MVNASPVGQTPSSNDEQLLKEVEQFASSDEPVSASAWQKLQSHSRSRLIQDLTKISEASTPDNHNRVLIAFTFCKLGHEYASNRKIVISALSKKSPFKNLFGDLDVSLVRRLMIQGDPDLLIPLFDASEWSDGAMSTELAQAYSQALVTEPEVFVQRLSSQSEATPSRVINLLQFNSLTADEKKKVNSSLKNLSRNSKVGPTAEQTMRALTN